MGIESEGSCLEALKKSPLKISKLSAFPFLNRGVAIIVFVLGKSCRREQVEAVWFGSLWSTTDSWSGGVGPAGSTSGTNSGYSSLSRVECFMHIAKMLWIVGAELQKSKIINPLKKTKCIQLK